MKDINKEMEELLERLDKATDSEKAFENLKLKITVRLIASIEDLSRSIDKLTNLMKR